MKKRADIEKEKRRLKWIGRLIIIIFIIQIFLLINIGHWVSDEYFIEEFFKLYSYFGIKDSFYLGYSVWLLVFLSGISLFISVDLFDSLKKEKGII